MWLPHSTGQSSPATSYPFCRTVKKKSTAPQVGLNTQKLICPNCRAPLGPKDILSSGWAKCPVCHEAVRLSGANSEFDDNILIKRLAKFTVTKDQHHKAFMSWVMQYGNYDFFDTAKTVSIKRKYFWVREFGQAKKRVIFPMCKYGKELFRHLCGHPYMLLEDYERYFCTKDMINFNSDDIRDTEIVPKEQSAAECRYEFSHTDVGSYKPTPNYYCLPVIEEVVEYHDKQYTMIGTANGNEWLFYYGEIPQSEYLNETKPRYWNLFPVTSILFGYIALIIIAILIETIKDVTFNNIVKLIIISVCGYLGAILLGMITSVIDSWISKLVNFFVRKKFRSRWKEYQEHKRLAAKRNMNIELNYEMPDFPIPESKNKLYDK